MLYAKIRLKEPVARSITAKGAVNYWPAGTEFYVTQKAPGYGMVCIEEGIGIPPEAAEIVQEFSSFGELSDAQTENWRRALRRGADEKGGDKS